MTDLAPIVIGGGIALAVLMVVAALWGDYLPWVVPWVVVVLAVLVVAAGGGFVGHWVAS